MRQAPPAMLSTALLLSSAAFAQPFDAPVLPGHEAGRRVWQGTCIGCHADGLAGAPPVGDAVAWAPRLAKGRPTLLKHALEGFFGADHSMMPPRGGNPKLSDAEVGVALDYMLALVRQRSSPTLKEKP
jgi:cytochrome c5